MEENHLVYQFARTAAFLTPEYGQAHATDPHEELFAEFSNSPRQDFFNASDMDYFTTPQNVEHYNNHQPLDFLKKIHSHGPAQWAILFSPENSAKEKDRLFNVHSHRDRDVIHTSLPDETALFVANYRHHWRETYDTEATIDQAIRICGGQRDTPDPNPTHGEIERDEFPVNVSSSSTSYTGSQSSRSATRRPRPSGRVSFRSSAVIQTDHEIFRDGGRMKVRCLESPCSGNVLMKDNYARHVRERHLGGKRKAGGSCRRGIRPGLK
ncbi:hypothetical protein DFH29DRAFT_997307 [Suillus ampliporus]|nr:hypothetical protein DFH29DRAFT_997307 [Suillus ampliporus]